MNTKMETVFNASGDPKKLAYKSLKLKLRSKAKAHKKESKGKVTHASLDVCKELSVYQKNEGSYRNFMFCPLIMAFCICMSSPVILIPQHDGILFPQYWYELMISTNLTFCLGWTLAALLDMKMILKIPSMVSIWSCIKIFGAVALSFDIIYCIVYFSWTYGLEYNYPVPFTNYTLYITSGIYFLTIWYQFPKEMRSNDTERKKLKSFCFLFLFCGFISAQITGLRNAFTKIPAHLQWIMALILPTLRHFDEKALNMIARRAAGFENLQVKGNICVTINVQFSSFIAIALGSLATPLTSYCILGVDFILNLYSCISIIRTHRKIDPQHLNSKTLGLQKIDEVTLLALTEVVEVLVPISYILTFLIAFYGPNALILGDIQNSYWEFSAIENIGKVLSGTGLMVFFDASFGLISGLMLWKFAKLHMLKEYSIALKQFWPIIAVRLANYSTKVSTISIQKTFQILVSF